jgi:hypothetical protein
LNAHPLSIARAACLVLLCGFALAGCDADDGITLGEVKKFDAYPLFYAGDEVAGHELEEIVGTCEPPEADEFGDHESCAPPIQIQVSSICDRHIGLGDGDQKLLDVRGAKAAANGGGLEIFTGRTTVVVFAIDKPNLLKPTVRQLRRLGQAAPADRLPPPVAGALQGKLPCPEKRG